MSITIAATRTIGTRAALGAVLAALVVLALHPGRAEALTASFTVTPGTPTVGQAATFRASATADAGQNVTRFDWTFGDGTSTSSTTATTTHTYALAGANTVTLTVTEVTPPGPAPAPPPPPEVMTAVSQTVTVNAPPAAGFTVTPLNPIPGSGMTFTSTSVDIDGTIASWSWDLDGNGRFGDATTPVATTTFLSAGNHKVSLRVTDNVGATATATQTIVVDTPPTAVIAFLPAVPLAGQTVTFTSKSTDPDPGGRIVLQEWDLTGDGLYRDGTGVTATKIFPVAGDVIVRLRVTDDRGVSSIAAVTVPVGGPPIAGFTVSPNPTAGRPVTFTSTSRDIDGAIANLQWDLTGRGLFNDAAGEQVSTTFATPGTYTVSLRATDTSGLTDVVFHSVVVRAPPAPAPAGGAAAPAARPPRPASLLLPFPIVRIAGRVSGRATRISLLEVRAPAGARIRVKCKGGGCPKADLTAVVRRTLTRFPKMRRRLRAGAKVEVFVRANGRIGKYTRFRIRRNRPPLRSDMCLPPTRRGPAPCTG